MSSELLVQITAPHFCAAIVVRRGKRVIEAAPILCFMIGWDGGQVHRYCRQKHWFWRVIEVTA